MILYLINESINFEQQTLIDVVECLKGTRIGLHKSFTIAPTVDIATSTPPSTPTIVIQTQPNHFDKRGLATSFAMCNHLH